ncbi:ABC transporter substrate-binding protein [Agrobacterium sp. CNPSo 675]|nr:ABC transporter substrate-binding protein [Agrobacterium tumefaciens]
MRVGPTVLRPTRRHVLQAGITTGLSLMPGFRGSTARAMPSHPLVVLDFAHAQSLVALGVETFGMAERWRYEQYVEEPRLPASVFDIGTLHQPNLELLARVQPQRIIHSQEWPTDIEQLARITSLTELSIYTGTRAPLDRARQSFLQIAEIADVTQRAADYMASFEDHMNACRSRLRPFEGKRVMELWAATPRDFWTLGTASLVHDVQEHLGLRNAVQESGDTWGWLPVTMRDLGALDDTIIIHFGPVPAPLSNNPLWNSFGFVRRRQLVVLPRSWLFGGLPEADRIARLLTQALEGRHHLSAN